MASGVTEERFVFEVDWFDQMASLVRKYLLTYYPKDSTIDMYDLKNRRMFLKRMVYQGVSKDQLYIGSIITVYSRQLKLVDYGDTFTRRHFGAGKETQFALIKPDVYMHTGKIIDSIYKNGFIISKLKMSRFDKPSASRFLSLSGQQASPENLDFLTSDVSIGLELVGPNSLKQWNKLVGPADPIKAKMEAPSSFRATYGTSVVKNAVHGSANFEEKAAESNMFFGREMRTSALFSNNTCCVIKPHAIVSGYAGQIIDIILEEGFEISAMQMFNLDRPTSEEFFEIYKGVLPDFSAMVDQMTTGPCIVLEVRQENAVKSFRELAGPMDPEIAAKLRPNTLRGRFGVDRARNAVHCTDLPEDGALECEYFFSIQQDD